MDGSGFDAEDLEPFRPDQATSGDDLQYKEACDGCGHHLSWIDTAFVCANECTWCAECVHGTGMTCPHCSIVLVRRPRRTRPVG